MAAVHGQHAAARAVPCPVHSTSGFRGGTTSTSSPPRSPRTRAIYVNSPHNPTGGVLTRADLEAIAALAEKRGIWIMSDEAYEDVVFDGGEHVSIASLAGMYDRTIPFYTFSKTYAMTGLRLGYVAVKDPKLRERMKKVLFYTASNIASIVQYGGIGALEGSQASTDAFRVELQARRDLFYSRLAEAAGSVFSGAPPKGAFYAFLRINPDAVPPTLAPRRRMRRCRGRWPNTSSRRDGSDACRAPTSARTAKATSASASRATGASSSGRSTP